jgi:hypothetical protein
MLHTGSTVFRVAAVAAVAAAGLLATPAAGAVADSSGGASQAGGQSVAPGALVIPEQERSNLVDLIADGASFEARTTAWTQSGTGVSIDQGNGTYLVVAAVKNSLDGDGATVATLTLNGTSGTNTATRYQANGVQKFEETFTLGAADANGLIPYNGSGKCTGPGTGAHKDEKCSYTYTGTLNPATQVVNFDISGTTTR